MPGVLSGKKPEQAKKPTTIVTEKEKTQEERSDKGARIEAAEVPPKATFEFRAQQQMTPTVKKGRKVKAKPKSPEFVADSSDVDMGNAGQRKRRRPIEPDSDEEPTRTESSGKSSDTRSTEVPSSTGCPGIA